MSSKKLPVALGMYAVLALLAWFTLTAPIVLRGREVRVGALVVAFLAILAARTLLHWRRERHDDARAHSAEVRG